MLPLKRATRPPSKNRAHLDTVQLVLNNRTMKIKTATTIFEVLASEVRLSIFRLLVKYAPEGLVAGEISQMLDIPKTNLSFHLKNIMYSGLVSMEREGRNTRYRANIPLMLETAYPCSIKPSFQSCSRQLSGMAESLFCCLKKCSTSRRYCRIVPSERSRSLR